MCDNDQNDQVTVLHYLSSVVEGVPGIFCFCSKNTQFVSAFFGEHEDNLLSTSYRFIKNLHAEYMLTFCLH